LGEVAKLGTLAERINAEHRACEGAATEALRHAIEAGRLLQQVKASLPHGTWLAWLDENFEGSARTAQVYLRLDRDRFLLEANAQSAAHLSIAGALDALVQPPKGLPQDVDPVAREQVSGQRLPPDEEAEERISDADYLLRTLAELFNGALDPYGPQQPGLQPEEALEALRRIKKQERERLFADLRNGAAWLRRVLEEAETRPD